MSSYRATYEDIDDRYNSNGSKYSNSDDGNISETNSNGTKLCVQTGKHSSGFVSVYDNVLDFSWCDFAYDIALQRQCKPWGVYVTTADVLDMNVSAEELKKLHPEKAIALEATRALLFNRASGLIGEDSSIIHGTAVWCLASSESNSVEYHIDYAELYRYENNIIVPPLYGATFHVSPLNDGEMEGGSFLVNTQGLKHYKAFGYKGRLSTPEKLQNDIATSQDWLEIKYKRNRGIVCDGDMPHFSSIIKRIPLGKKRVILGFNCFTEAVSECNLRAPEHSDAFNRTIRLYQTMGNLRNSSTEKGSDEDASKSKMSAKDLLKNPALARLVVLAARKVKEHEKANKISLP